MRNANWVVLLAGSLALGTIGTGCDDDSTDTRTTGEKVDNAMDKAGDKLERGVEKTGDALEKAGEKVEEGFDKTKEKAKEVGRDIRDGADRTEDKIDRKADVEVNPRPAPPTTRPIAPNN